MFLAYGERDMIPGIPISTMVVIWFRGGGLGDEEVVFVLVADRDEEIDIVNVCLGYSRE